MYALVGTLSRTFVYFFEVLEEVFLRVPEAATFPLFGPSPFPVASDNDSLFYSPVNWFFSQFTKSFYCARINNSAHAPIRVRIRI